MSIHKLISSFVLVLCLGLFCGQAVAAEFSADLVITQPKETYTIKLFVKGDLYRLEKLDGEEKFLAIENRATNMTIGMDPEQKLYKEIEGMAGAFVNPIKGWESMIERTEKKSIGTETVGGYECEHAVYNYPGETKSVLESWISSKLDFFVKYVVHYDGEYGDGVMEITNVVEGPQDDALFVVPADYTREKTPEEIEMERPAITSSATAEAPVARRVAVGGQLIVRADPELSVRVKIENLIQDSSICRVVPYSGGQAVDFSNESPPPRTVFSVRYKGEQTEKLYGLQNNIDEVRVDVERGRLMVTVFNEYSSFDDTTQKQYYVNPPGRGIAAVEGKPFSVKLIGDSPTAEFSVVRFHAYNQKYDDDGREQKTTVEELEFQLKNGEVKTFDYPVETGANYVLIDLDEGGGVKLFTAQPRR